MLRRAFLVTSLSALAVCGLFAQGTTSRLIGTAQDPSGAPVVGATVKLINEGTNATFTTKTAENGAYFFEAVQSGLYTVTVEASGFKKFSTPRNRVAIGQPTTVNITLELGQISEVVTVADSAEVVQTSTSGNIGNLFSEKVIQDLPIVGTRGRNPLDLVVRQPGVVSGANTGGGVHVNGARDRAWNYTVDGIDANETSAGGSNFAPIRMNPDGLAEFKVLTGNSTAEYGRNSGGQVAMVTKSGTNEIHGSLFWFYRTPSLNANEWESNLNNVGKRQYVQNMPGFSVGGPVLKNKLFYYANLQLLRTRESAIVNSTVYTQSARDGIWRYVKGGRNQPAGVTGASVDAQGNVLPGVNLGTYNIATSDPDGVGLNPTTKAIAQGAPLPNNFSIGDGLNTAAYTFTALQFEKQYDLTTRLDYILNSRNTLFARISLGNQNSNCDRGNGGAPVFPTTPCLVNTMRDPKNYAFNWRSTPSTSTTNELVVGLNQFAFNFENPRADINKINLVSLPVANPDDWSVGNQRALKTWQVVDNFAWFKGAHSLKFGTNMRFGSHTDTRGSVGGYNVTQSVDFSRTVNTVDAAKFGLPADINQANDRNPLESSINFLLGRVGNTNRGFPSTADAYVVDVYNFETRFNEYDFFAQDTWKARRNLTIDLGLRLELKMAPTNPDGRVRLPNQAVVAGAAPSNSLNWVPGSLYRNAINNWGPSLGFAWDPFSSGKTSIRGNYRIAYDRINTFVFSSTVFQNLPGIAVGDQNTTFGQNGGRLTSLPVLNAPAGKPSDQAQPAAFSTRNITVADPNFQAPTTQQWSFGIQREVLHNTVVEVNYLGRRAYNLFGAYNANQTDIRNNGFMDAVKVVNAGGESPLINQIMSVDARKTASETGSAAMRRIYSVDLRNNNVAFIGQDLSRRSVGGKGQVEAAGLSPFFFIPYPQFANGMNVVDSNDWSTYHGLQMQVQRHMTNGLEVQFSYTFSKSLDTRSFDPAFTTVGTANSSTAGSTPFDINNRRLNYGPSDFDRRHVAQTYWLYELPFGKGHKFGGNASGWTQRIIGGWQVAGVGTFQSGRPFSVYSGFYTFNNVVQSFANCDGCTPTMGNVQDGPGGVKWFFTADQLAKFKPLGMGELGNTGRNFFRSPGGWGLDGSFLKRTAITERVNFEFRADMTNLTNTPQFGAPTATATSTIFGRIRDTVLSSSRKIQLGAKINF
ncbi:MAG: carboxypeptidase regulatory-like domain-containing protein [Acidobacteria bacterium]|nr:carboxypeptidase regulatory-like domain-containing protein [Acidobacteriota bacterium]